MRSARLGAPFLEVVVGKQLERAIDKMRALPEQEQDALSDFVLEVIEEREFDQLLASDASLRLLERMAQAALDADRRGGTVDIDEVIR